MSCHVFLGVSPETLQQPCNCERLNFGIWEQPIKQLLGVQSEEYLNFYENECHIMNIRGSCPTRITDRFRMADIAAGKAAYPDLCGREVEASGATVKESFIGHFRLFQKWTLRRSL